MGIATWMMGKMMDKFLALPPSEKAQVIGTMAEKFWAAASPEETARVAEILLPRLLSPSAVSAAMSSALPSALPAALPSALASQLPAALQGMLPQMVEAWFRGLGDQQKKDLFGSLMPAAVPAMPKPPRPPSGGMMGGMMGGGGGPWG